MSEQNSNENMYTSSPFNQIEQKDNLLLATPAQRFCAVFINQMLIGIIFMPLSMHYALFIASIINSDLIKDSNGSSPVIRSLMISKLQQWWTSTPTQTIIALTIILLLILTIWQIVWMSKYGQSIGKRISNIRVVTTTGDNPGFIRNVLLREILFKLLLIAGIVFTFGLGFLLYILSMLLVFITSIKRRMLQDYLAQTIVVKVDKPISDKKIKIRTMKI